MLPHLPYVDLHPCLLTIAEHTNHFQPSSSTSAPPTPPPNGNGNKNTRWRSFLQNLGRVTLITVVAGTGVFVYFARKDKRPGEQLPFDEKKKTVVVLGSGWGATSFLRSLDTEDYNVVSCSFPFLTSQGDVLVWQGDCCIAFVFATGFIAFDSAIFLH